MTSAGSAASGRCDIDRRLRVVRGRLPTPPPVLRLLALALLLLPAAAAQPADPGVQGDLDLLSRADAARAFGADESKPMIVEFADYACSACSAFSVQRGDSLFALAEDGTANVIFRVYPIPRLLRGFQAAEAAFCAGALGGNEAFLSVHKALFRERQAWVGQADPTPTFVRYAEAAGLYIPDFRGCLARDAMAPLILSDVQLSEAVDLTGTPTFVLSQAGSDDFEKFDANTTVAEMEAALARPTE